MVNYINILLEMSKDPIKDNKENISHKDKKPIKALRLRKGTKKTITINKNNRIINIPVNRLETSQLYKVFNYCP